MSAPSNSRAGLVALAAGAAAVAREGTTAAELIPLLGAAAEEHRASDPVLVERIAQLTASGGSSRSRSPPSA